jgi:uncharacterized membrane protein
LVKKICFVIDWQIYVYSLFTIITGDKCPLTDMVVLAFDDIDTAEKVRGRLIDLNTQYLLRLDQAVEVVRENNGKIKIKDEPRLTGIGAFGGAFWGLLIGFIFLMPLLGVVVGEVSGAVVGHFTRYGINKEYMKQVEAAIQPGQSAIFIKADDVKIDRVVPMLQEFHPRVLRTSLTTEQEEKLKEAFGGSAVAAPMTATTT